VGGFLNETYKDSISSLNVIANRRLIILQFLSRTCYAG